MIAQRRERSVAQLDRFLTARYGGDRLNNDDLVEAKLFGSLDHVWKVRPGTNAPIPQLLVGVDGRYPLSLPRVFLPDPAQWHLHIPHVSREGMVCVLPEQATGDARQICEVADHLIRSAVATIEDGISGKNRSDFLAEAESYWAGAASAGATPVWSLVKPAPPSREISCVDCQCFLVAGNSPEECQRWLRNYARCVAGSITSGMFVWTKRGIFPDDYFENNGQLLAFLAAEDAGMLAKLAKLADGRRSRIPVVIGMQTPNGPALLAISLNDSARKPSAKLHGFRPGALPPALFAKRFGHDASTRHIVRRIYPEWIHSRGGAKGKSALAQKKITLIGCGALGCEVANMLAKAGLQQLMLVDGDRLDWDNIGRHLLGARDVGKNKATALRNHLLGQLPHLEIAAEACAWEQLLESKPGLFVNTDLVISLTGEWASESPLNTLAKSRSRPPVLFGWIEPHGYAAHALLVAARGGCLACGRNEFGEVRHKVTDWKDSQLEPVPACGGFYEPYGAAETAPIKSMVCSLAIETLLKDIRHSELRTWIGNVSLVEALGGEIAPAWSSKVEDRTVIGRIIRQEWPIHPQCEQCREA
jgi:sulfur-carrier protein adenylyltransferase/sulfurtransferase